MKIGRASLLDHLRAIQCGNLIPEAVFTGAFACSAVSEDQTMVVDAPGLEGAEDLPEDVGVQFLSLLIQALGVADAEEAEVRVENRRLVAGVGGAQVALVTADPANIHSHVSAEIMDTVRDAVPAHDPSPIGVRVLSELRAVAGVVDAYEIALEGGPDGSRFVVGKDTENQGVVDAPDITLPEPARLIFPASTLVTVLTQAGPEATFLGGPEAAVRIRSGAYDYYVSVLDPEE